MRLHTGLHPNRWHVGAWILLALLLVLALVLSHRATGDVAWAAPNPTEPPANTAPPGREDPPPVDPDTLVPGDETDLGSGEHYVAEVVDSLFFVSPAGFLALDLPRDPERARAVHLSGHVAVRGKNRDIQLRLFRAKDYDAWLHPNGGRKGAPVWASKRVRATALDLALPEGGPFVLLLDNGFSIRTPKHVSCQLQIQYRRNGSGGPPSAAGDRPRGGKGPGEGEPDEENPVTPRSNTDEDIPPPPPPPPGGY